MLKDYNQFSQLLVAWFAENHRDLPWRRTYDPYQVWVSEIMLQQTQMERVIEYFNHWLQIFPDIPTLADASEQRVLKAWEGLGYYSRARNILKAARHISVDLDGQIPEDYDMLLTLPGIGPYTAGAIMSIAYDRPYPVIDANVERLFSRIDDVEKPMKDLAVSNSLKEKLIHMVQDVSPRYFNQGLMELGALVCTPSRPDCTRCPVLDHCKAHKAGTVPNRPVKTKKQETIDIIMACTIIENKGRFFIQQRHDNDVWGGLWEFPGGRLKNGESAKEAAKRELFEETEIQIDDLVSFQTVTHYYTKYRVTLHAFICTTGNNLQPKIHAAQQYKWVSLDGLSEYAFPSGHRQLVKMIKKSPDTFGLES